MKEFYDENIFLDNETAKLLYQEIKDLPIIDYHCHLDSKMIYEDKKIMDIGELWLSNDHYKWRAMRMNNIEENFITGNASYHEKFLSYAKIMPNLVNNPLYHWAHLELKNIYDIHLPLNEENAETIYQQAQLKGMNLTVRQLLKKFAVEVICTTDDPLDDLLYHQNYDGLRLTPTFRTDKILSLDEEYLTKLSHLTNIDINSAASLINAIENRLTYFVKKGCFMSDQSFESFPKKYCSLSEAEILFQKRNCWSLEEKDCFFGFLLEELGKLYRKNNITMQIHFAVKRNVNSALFKQLGPDTGLDIMSNEVDIQDVINYLNRFSEDDRPQIILYSLNDNSYASLACLSGAFKNVYLGAAWWFNDTKNTILKNLTILSEYACLGTHLGMLTDSRSFSSYIRFDYFRRILASYFSSLIEKGEYNLSDAIKVCKNISYFNASKLINQGVKINE